MFYLGFLLQRPSELKKLFSYAVVFVTVGILDLGDVFFPCSYFYSSISHARQRDVELQTCPAAMPSNMVLINPRGESQFLIATPTIKAPGEAIIPGVQNSLPHLSRVVF